MNEKENATEKQSSLCEKIYEEMKKHVGKNNSISMENLAKCFNISERHLRHCLAAIRQNSDFEFLILSCNNGYFIPTSKEEYKQASKRLYSQAFSLLRIARKQEKKAGLHRQGKLSEDFNEFFKSYMQDD